MDKKEKAPFFTPKRKLMAVITSLAAALLWFLLSRMFYFEFYSIFFASGVGSTVLIMLIAAVITFPQNLISSKALKADISVPLHLAVNIVGMTGCIFLYSIFRYTNTILLILGLAAHLALTGYIFTKAPAEKVNRIKETVSKKKLFFGGLLSALLSDLIYLLLFYGVMESFLNYDVSSSMHY